MNENIDTLSAAAKLKLWLTDISARPLQQNRAQLNEWAASHESVRLLDQTKTPEHWMPASTLS